MTEEYLTVTEINNYISKKFKTDNNLTKVFVKGEISGYKVYPSGHGYFTLKDENSKISGIIFYRARRNLKFKPEDGMKVLIEGKIEVYPKNGAYQIYTEKMTEAGVGDLHVAFEQLKKKLEKEGLFDKSHKKEIPKFPKRIGVVTAETGAAIKDVITTIKRRWPICEVILFPTLVQGDKASNNIVLQIKRAENYNLDTLIVGRGGGSIEDLWSFNEENVARAIYNCSIPTISAVGHEIDFTIADFVADLRAPTPTAAGELAVPNRDEILNKVHEYYRRAHLSTEQLFNENKIRLDKIKNSTPIKYPESLYEKKEFVLDNLITKLNHEAESIISSNKYKLTQLSTSLNYNNPEQLVKYKQQDLNEVKMRLTHSAQGILNKKEQELDKYKNKAILTNPYSITDNKKIAVKKYIHKLEVLNPLLTLKRGYTLTKTEEGKVITSSKDVKKGDNLEIEFTDGNINTKVI